MTNSVGASDPPLPTDVPRRRWVRIIPVLVVTYMISYVDRTNVALALDPQISTMMRDLAMTDSLKGLAAGIFFLSYFSLQVPGGHWGQHWSAKKLITICLVVWGFSAMACGFAQTFGQFVFFRLMLGLGESSVFPAMTVLLAHWFPRSERVRANAYWQLCLPLAIVLSAPFTGWCLGAFGWRAMLVIEGALPLIWLPIWWLCISDHPAKAKWISPEERAFLETRFEQERTGSEQASPMPIWRVLMLPAIPVMIAIAFLAYSSLNGCMIFFTSTLKEGKFSAVQYSVLFALPYLLTMLVMILTSWNSDRTGERRGHIAVVLAVSGASLVVSVALHGHFWLSYAFLCLAIPGPFAFVPALFAIPSEALPRHATGAIVGLVNGVGGIGGFVGPFFVGWLSQIFHGVAVPFVVLGIGMLVAAALAFLLPKSRHEANERA